MWPQLEDFIDPLYSCGNSIESIHFCLHYANCTLQRQTFLKKQKSSTDPNILAQKEETFVVKTFLSRKSDFWNLLNKEIVSATISFSLSTECFSCPLFSSWPISHRGVSITSISFYFHSFFFLSSFYYNFIF